MVLFTGWTVWKRSTWLFAVVRVTQVAEQNDWPIGFARFIAGTRVFGR
jgi:hypothetical protein